MNDLIVLQKFPTLESAESLITLLNQNNIPYQIDDTGKRFSLVYNPTGDFIFVKIQKSDLEKAQSILSEIDEDDSVSIGEDHYLYTFSDSDIIDVIANQSEWSKEEIKLANEIALQRKLDLSAETLKNAKKKKLEEEIRTEQKERGKIKNTANWFLIIAVLSVLNTISLTMQLNFRLIFGLGITQVIDGVIYRTTNSFNFYNIITSILISSVFVVFWFFARKEKKWAFVIGTIVYGIDTLLFLMVDDLMSVGFHIFVISGIIAGYLVLLGKKTESVITE